MSDRVWGAMAWGGGEIFGALSSSPSFSPPPPFVCVCCVHLLTCLQPGGGAMAGADSEIFSCRPPPPPPSPPPPPLLPRRPPCSAAAGPNFRLQTGPFCVPVFRDRFLVWGTGQLGSWAGLHIQGAPPPSPSSASSSVASARRLSPSLETGSFTEAGTRGGGGVRATFFIHALFVPGTPGVRLWNPAPLHLISPLPSLMRRHSHLSSPSLPCSPWPAAAAERDLVSWQGTGAAGPPEGREGGRGSAGGWG